MDADRLQRIQEIFHAALERPEAERGRFLDEICGSDTSLRDAVLRYLRADAEDFALLDTPVVRIKVDETEAEPPILPAGHLIGGYRIERLLGRGGMGMVYRAYDEKLDRAVALKLLPPHLSSNEHAKGRFIYEARAAAALDHPNIATIYEVGEVESGRLFIAMAYYEGETLEQKIACGPMLAEEALRITSQIARGLDAAHRKKVIHRDIKPANLIVTPDRLVKIVDFGIAQIAGDDRTRAGQLVGTIAYMSPEQARGEEIDRRSDLWSLGCVLYEMLTGDRPFHGASARGILDAILNESPEPLEKKIGAAPEPLQRLIDRLLARQPSRRYQEAADLLADLERLGAQDTIQSGRPVWLEAIERLPDNLPVQLTSFVGRDVELEQARALLGQARLLTLTGAGGTGKTRFSLQLANAVRERFPDGTSFVALASLNSADIVPSTIARALGVRERENVPIKERLIAFLEGKSALLILDNFEHLIQAGSFIAELLAACDLLKIIVTSRISLRIQGEHEFPVPPLHLTLPGEDNVAQAGRSEAVDLFVQRTRAVKPSFEINEANRSVITEICTRLDGLPLAIELAAARIKVLSPAAILERLQHRFNLLIDGPRDLPVRHRTLREAIAWSYDLLTKDEKRLFRRLAVFVSGHTLDAAEHLGPAVSGLSIDVLEGMSSLVDKNLIRQEEMSTGDPRFFMLETIREFGLECLIASGEELMTRRIHRDYFLAFAEMTRPELTGPDQAAWLTRIEREHDNMRAAQDFTRNVDGDIGKAARFGAALWRFWLMRGYLSEGSERLGDILIDSRAVMEQETRAGLLTGAGTLAHNQGRYREARVFYEESLALYRERNDVAGIALSLNNIGWIAWRLGEYDEAQVISEESVSLCRSEKEVYGMAQALNNLGWVAQSRGEYVRAQIYFEEVLTQQRALDNRRGIAFALNCLGWTMASRGERDRGMAFLEQALNAFQVLGDLQMTAFTLSRLGDVYRDRGETERAIALFERESFPLFRRIGDTWGIAYVHSGLGRAFQDEGSFDKAQFHFEESLDLRRGVEDAYGIAESLGRLSGLQRLMKDTERADDGYRESLSLRRRIGDKGGVVECLEGFAGLALDRKLFQRAARLFAAAESLRTSLGSVRAPRDQTDYRNAIDYLRDQIGESAFRQWWDYGQSLSYQQAIEYSFEKDDAI